VGFSPFQGTLAPFLAPFLYPRMLGSRISGDCAEAWVLDVPTRRSPPRLPGRSDWSRPGPESSTAPPSSAPKGADARAPTSRGSSFRERLTDLEQHVLTRLDPPLNLDRALSRDLRSRLSRRRAEL